MGEKTFGRWEIDQSRLSPPRVRDFVPEGHLAHFVRDVAREELDLSAIFAHSTELRGYPPYHPALMTALLLSAQCRGFENVHAEWTMSCTAHNLLKLAAARAH